MSQVVVIPFAEPPAPGAVDGPHLYLSEPFTVSAYLAELGVNTAHDDRYNHLYAATARVLDPASVEGKAFCREHLGVDPGVTAADLARFTDRLDADPAVRAAYLAAYDTHVAYRPDGRALTAVPPATLNRAIEVDGNVRRFVARHADPRPVAVPPEVGAVILRNAGIHAAHVGWPSFLVRWAEAHAPKDEGPLSVWRGLAWRVDPDAHPAELDALTREAFGLRRFADLAPGARVTFEPGRPTSWSRERLIAREFMAGLAARDLNVLLRAEVGPDQVLIDLPLLPAELFARIATRNLVEALLRDRPITATVEEVVLSEGLATRLAPATAEEVT